MKAVGCDLYNFALTGVVACALNANTGLSANHAGPSVLIEMRASKNGAHPLDDNDDKEPKAVCYAIDQQGGKNNCSYSKDVMVTLCSDSHGTPHGVCYEKKDGED